MKNSLISIIIPIYNLEKYLSECLDSIINQSYCNLEIIAINDGSTDGSLDICYKKQKIDKRILVIDKINEGVSVTRNHGISLAKGDYICFIDGDDFIDKFYVEKLLIKILENESDVAICEYAMYHDNNLTKIDTVKLLPYNKDNDDFFQHFLVPFFRLDSKNYLMGSACRMIIKTSLIKENDILFEKCKITEDLLFVLEIFSKSKKISVINQSLYFYRLNPNSASHKKYISKFLEDREIYFDKLNQILNSLNLNDEQKQKVSFFTRMDYLAALVLNAANGNNYLKEINDILNSKYYKNKWKIYQLYKYLKGKPFNQKVLMFMIKFRMFRFIYFVRKH